MIKRFLDFLNELKIIAHADTRIYERIINAVIGRADDQAVQLPVMWKSLNNKTIQTRYDDINTALSNLTTEQHELFSIFNKMLVDKIELIEVVKKRVGDLPENLITIIDMGNINLKVLDHTQTGAQPKHIFFPCPIYIPGQYYIDKKPKTVSKYCLIIKPGLYADRNEQFLITIIPYAFNEGEATIKKLIETNSKRSKNYAHIEKFDTKYLYLINQSIDITKKNWTLDLTLTKEAFISDIEKQFSFKMNQDLFVETFL